MFNNIRMDRSAYMVTIYAVAQMYLDGDNYRQVSEPVTDWYISREEAQKICDKKNKHLWEKLKQENQVREKDDDRANKEYEALVAAGLRKPREQPYKSWRRTYLEDEFVVVDAQLV